MYRLLPGVEEEGRASVEVSVGAGVAEKGSGRGVIGGQARAQERQEQRAAAVQHPHEHGLQEEEQLPEERRRGGARGRVKQSKGWQGWSGCRGMRWRSVEVREREEKRQGFSRHGVP